MCTVFALTNFAT